MYRINCRKVRYSRKRKRMAMYRGLESMLIGIAWTFIMFHCMMMMAYADRGPLWLDILKYYSLVILGASVAFACYNAVVDMKKAIRIMRGI